MANIFADIEVPEEQQHQEEMETYEEILEEEYPSEGDSRLSAAMRTLEKAKLYETLINHSVFGPNSARPDIQAEVEEELRTFVDDRLNVLLGVKPATAPHVPQAAVFSDDEVKVLKQLAGRALQRAAETHSPSVVTAPASVSPQVAQVPAQKQPSVNQVTSARRPQAQPQRKSTRRAPARRTTEAAHVDPSVVNPNRPRSQNVSDKTGKDYSQASSRKALPMPTSQQLEQIMAMRVKEPTNAASGAGSDGGIMSHAINLALK